MPQTADLARLRAFLESGEPTQSLGMVSFHLPACLRMRIIPVYAEKEWALLPIPALASVCARKGLGSALASLSDHGAKDLPSERRE